MIRHDPIEQTPAYRAAEPAVDALIRSLIGKPGKLGYCHRYWTLKKQILLRDYSIRWRSPAELNPDVIFD